ncbi:hypothetical protein GCM10023149_53830 [Mucilaginibacter gynuensis]|uniref:DUF5683 domain-containing protein n=1 Tax=Mucilaginibacter gynuensis TaxID=1302236 RepID=A0ABP8HN26_9SPHI
MLKHLLIIFLLTVAGFAAKAQTTDSTAVSEKAAADTVPAKKADTGKKSEKPKKETKPSVAFKPQEPTKSKYHPDSTHSPHKAVMRSLMVPGWGQAYNRKWWKVPIVYTGLGLLGSAVIFNQKYYSEFLAVAKYRRRGEAPNPGDKYYQAYQDYSSITQTNIESYVDGYRRNRDLSILGILGAWGIQMVDAYIDAKFMHSYTMDEDLSIRITPGLINQPMYASNINSTYIPGIKLTFTF